MTTLKGKSNSLNDKIQAFRENILSLVGGLSNIHGIVEIARVKDILENANLNAWNAQIINEGYYKKPRIECSYSRDFAKKINEVKHDNQKLAICTIDLIIQIINCIEELFEMLNMMNKQLRENHEENLEIGFKSEESVIETTTYELQKTFNHLEEATLRTSLFFERHSPEV